MNPLYYTTPEELNRVVDVLNRNNIGGGVQGTRLNQFIGPFVVPELMGKAMVIIILHNDVEMNAGLTYDLLFNKGYSELFTLSMLSAMANAR